MKYFKLFLFSLVCNSFFQAQVGVNTTTIDASAALEIQYGTSPKGLLTPRMTTIQKNAILNPADGLMVYDTDLKSFYHYKTGTPGNWVRMNSDVSDRSNYKRIKSISDLAAEKVGNSYVLKKETYYEINGTITVDFPIDLNNAYIVGLDANEDKLVSSGILFQGNYGGTIKNLSLVGNSGGTLFSLNGTATQGGVNAQNLIFRDCIVQQFASIGTIQGFGIVFSSVVQYVGNGNGITYNNITRLLLNNMAWFGNNGGTFEKFTGTFNLIQKLGGFSDLSAGTFGIDVSSNPVITGDAVLESVVFTGDTTGAKYVNKYTTGSYPNFYFNNSWNVRSTGIPNETDANAVGEFSFDYAVGSGAPTAFNTSSPSNIVKVQGVSSSSNLFRFSTGNTNNKLVYLGKKKRFFQVTGSISFQVPKINTYIIYIAKNGTVISQYKIYGRASAANDIVVLPLNALVEMSTNDSIEVFAQRYSNTNITDDTILVPNMTLVIK